MNRNKTTTQTIPPQTTNALKTAVQQHLETLGITISDELLDQSLRTSEQQNLSYLEFLQQLFGAQAAAKQQRIIERRVRDAKFPSNKTLETFDWQFNAAAIDRAQIEELATGDFIRRADNLLIVGQSGIGKSHICEGLGRRACLQQYRVRYINSDDLLADLGASLADGTTPKRIRYYTRFELLIIDGFGFDRIEREQAPQALSLLYKVINKRCPQRSTALITNIDFDAWNEYLDDDPIVMALLDRLFFHAIILRYPQAKSYRAHQARHASSSTGPGKKPALKKPKPT